MPPVPNNDPTTYVLMLAVAGLFGFLVKIITDQRSRDAKAIDDANARTVAAIADGNARVAAANATMVDERRRYDILLERVVNEVKQQGEQMDGLYEILSRHLEYTREVMRDTLNPPPAPPAVAKPGRRLPERTGP